MRHHVKSEHFGGEIGQCFHLASTAVVDISPSNVRHVTINTDKNYSDVCLDAFEKISIFVLSCTVARQID